jgi:hypothetical protein
MVKAKKNEKTDNSKINGIESMGITTDNNEYLLLEHIFKKF